MLLKDLLKEKSPAIVRRWFNLVVETYPADTVRFLKREKDQFANPVGHKIAQGLEGLFAQLIGNGESETATAFLDDIIRVRAIQDFSPSRAVSFVFGLKKLVRDEVAREADEGLISPAELVQLETRIDKLALLAFDIYMQCREKLYSLKANEIRNRTFMLLKDTGRVSEIPEEDKDGDGKSGG